MPPFPLTTSTTSKASRSTSSNGSSSHPSAAPTVVAYHGNSSTTGGGGSNSTNKKVSQSSSASVHTSTTETTATGNRQRHNTSSANTTLVPVVSRKVGILQKLVDAAATKQHGAKWSHILNYLDSHCRDGRVVTPTAANDGDSVSPSAASSSASNKRDQHSTSKNDASVADGDNENVESKNFDVQLPFESPLPTYLIPSEELRHELWYDQDTGESLLRRSLEKAVPSKIVAAFCHLGPEAVTAVDQYERLPLHYACMANRGVTSGDSDNTQQTTSTTSVANPPKATPTELEKIMTLLIKAHPASLIHRDYAGRTPLHYLFWFHASTRTPDMVKTFCTTLPKTMFYYSIRQGDHHSEIDIISSMMVTMGHRSTKRGSDDDDGIITIDAVNGSINVEERTTQEQQETAAAAVAAANAFSKKYPLPLIPKPSAKGHVSCNAAIVPDAIHGCIPLHYAIMCGARVDSISVLMRSYPLSRHVCDRYGRTPLHWYLGAGSLPDFDHRLEDEQDDDEDNDDDGPAHEDYQDSTCSVDVISGSKQQPISPSNSSAGRCSGHRRRSQSRNDNKTSNSSEHSSTCPSDVPFMLRVTGEPIGVDSTSDTMLEPWYEHRLNDDLIVMLLSSRVARTADRRGRHPLHWAAAFLGCNYMQSQNPGHAMNHAVVKLLLDHYVGQIYIRDEADMTPLMILFATACRMQRMSYLRLSRYQRIKRRALYNLKSGGRPSLFIPSMDFINMLLIHPDDDDNNSKNRSGAGGTNGSHNSSVTPNIASMEDVKGRLPIHMAIECASSTDIIQRLVELYPASLLHTSSTDDMVPLHMAFVRPYTAPIQTSKTIQILLSKYEALPGGGGVVVRGGNNKNNRKTNKNNANNSGCSIIDGRIALKMEDVVGNTPIHYACMNQACLDVVRTIVSTYPKSAFILNPDGDLPLHCVLDSELISVIITSMTEGMATATSTPIMESPMNNNNNKSNLYPFSEMMSADVPFTYAQGGGQQQEHWPEEKKDDGTMSIGTNVSSSGINIKGNNINNNGTVLDGLVLERLMILREKARTLLEPLIFKPALLKIADKRRGMLPIHCSIFLNALPYPMVYSMLQLFPESAMEYTKSIDPTNTNAVGAVGSSSLTLLDLHEICKPAMWMKKGIGDINTTTSGTPPLRSRSVVDGGGKGSMATTTATMTKMTKLAHDSDDNVDAAVHHDKEWHHVRELLFSYCPMHETHRHRQELLDRCVRIVVNELRGIVGVGSNNEDEDEEEDDADGVVVPRQGRRRRDRDRYHWDQLQLHTRQYHQIIHQVKQQELQLQMSQQYSIHSGDGGNNSSHRGGGGGGQDPSTSSSASEMQIVTSLSMDDNNTTKTQGGTKAMLAASTTTAAAATRKQRQPSGVVGVGRRKHSRHRGRGGGSRSRGGDGGGGGSDVNSVGMKSMSSSSLATSAASPPSPTSRGGSSRVGGGGGSSTKRKGNNNNNNKKKQSYTSRIKDRIVKTALGAVQNSDSAGGAPVLSMYDEEGTGLGNDYLELQSIGSSSAEDDGCEGDDDDDSNSIGSESQSQSGTDDDDEEDDDVGDFDDDDDEEEYDDDEEFVGSEEGDSTMDGEYTTTAGEEEDETQDGQEEEGSTTDGGDETTTMDGSRRTLPSNVGTNNSAHEEEEGEEVTSSDFTKTLALFAKTQQNKTLMNGKLSLPPLPPPTLERIFESGGTTQKGAAASDKATRTTPKASNILWSSSGHPFLSANKSSSSSIKRYGISSSNINNNNDYYATVGDYERPSYFSEVGLRLWTFFSLYCDASNPNDNYVVQVKNIFDDIGYAGVRKLICIPLPPYAFQYLDNTAPGGGFIMDDDGASANGCGSVELHTQLSHTTPTYHQQHQYQHHQQQQLQQQEQQQQRCFQDVASPKCRELIHRTFFFVGKYDFDCCCDAGAPQSVGGSYGRILVHRDIEDVSIIIQADEWIFTTEEVNHKLKTVPGYLEEEVWKTGNAPYEVGLTFRTTSRKVWIKFTKDAVAYHNEVSAYDQLQKRAVFDNHDDDDEDQQNHHQDTVSALTLTSGNTTYGMSNAGVAEVSSTVCDTVGLVPLISHYNANNTTRKVDRTYRADIKDKRFSTVKLYSRGVVEEEGNDDDYDAAGTGTTTSMDAGGGGCSANYGDDDDDDRQRRIDSIVGPFSHRISLQEYPYALVYPASCPGTLYDYIVDHGIRSTEEAKEIASSVVRSLGFVHRHGFVHGDVTVRNIAWDDTPRRSTTSSVSCGPGDDDHGDLGGTPSLRWSLMGLSMNSNLSQSKQQYLGMITSQGIAQYTVGCLPPEMFTRLTPCELKAYWSYWNAVETVYDVNVTKSVIEPMVDLRTGETYVVKCFYSQKDEANNDRETGRLPKLPYPLIPQSFSADLWALGQLLFTLFSSNGRTLANSLTSLYCDSTCHLDYRGSDAPSCGWDLQSVAGAVYEYVDDPLAQDLLLKLLSSQQDRDNESIDGTILNHPLFASRTSLVSVPVINGIVEKRRMEAAAHKRSLQTKMRELHEQRYIRELDVSLSACCWDLDLLERMHTSPSSLIRNDRLQQSHIKKTTMLRNGKLMRRRRRDICIPCSIVFLPYDLRKRNGSSSKKGTNTSSTTNVDDNIKEEAGRLGEQMIALSKTCYFASLLKKAIQSEEDSSGKSGKKWSTSDMLYRLSLSKNDFHDIQSEMTFLASQHVELFRDDPLAIAYMLVKITLKNLLKTYRRDNKVFLYLVDEYHCRPIMSDDATTTPYLVNDEWRERVLQGGVVFMYLCSLYSRGVSQSLAGLLNLLHPPPLKQTHEVEHQHNDDADKAIPESWSELGRGLCHTLDEEQFVAEVHVLQDVLNDIFNSTKAPMMPISPTKPGSTGGSGCNNRVVDDNVRMLRDFFDHVDPKRKLGDMRRVSTTSSIPTAPLKEAILGGACIWTTRNGVEQVEQIAKASSFYDAIRLMRRETTTEKNNCASSAACSSLTSDSSATDKADR